MHPHWGSTLFSIPLRLVLKLLEGLDQELFISLPDFVWASRLFAPSRSWAVLLAPISERSFDRAASSRAFNIASWISDADAAGASRISLSPVVLLRMNLDQGLASSRSLCLSASASLMLSASKIRLISSAGS